MFWTRFFPNSFTGERKCSETSDPLHTSAGRIASSQRCDGARLERDYTESIYL